MAIYGGQPPSEYYARQDARKDDKFRDIINLFLQLKQMKTGQDEREWKRGVTEKELRQSRERLEMQKPYYDAMTGAQKALETSRLTPDVPKKSSMQEKVEMLIAAGEDPKEAMRLAAIGRDPRIPVSQTPEAMREKEIDRNERVRERQRVRDEKKVSGLYKRIERERDSLVKKLEGSSAYTYTTPEKQKIQESVGNMSAILDAMSPQYASVSNVPLGDDSSRFIDHIFKNFSKIKDGNVLEGFDMGGEVQTQQELPLEVQDYLKKNPGVPVDVAMGLYQEWLKKK